ncbi:MAG: helix-turn-helix domain-containing protein, partial [Bacteroidia bacterium]|nr:helix-turn-helix domain-containing protein [Bacteroidia bacterium]
MARVLSMDQALVDKLNKILEDNLEKEHFGISELAGDLGLSRSQLYRKLKYLTNKTPSRYIREFRLKKAMVMLQNNEATASEIAYRVGFNSPSYFNTCFHDYYGYPPGEVKFKKQKDKQVETSTIVTQIPRRIRKIRVFNRRLVWINAVAILLLSVFGYKLYQNFKDYNFNEIAIIDDQEKSIAILPFKNLSNDEENQYFAEGVAGSIPNNSTKITDLRVIPM